MKRPVMRGSYAVAVAFLGPHCVVNGGTDIWLRASLLRIQARMSVHDRPEYACPHYVGRITIDDLPTLVRHKHFVCYTT
jgi:hypothetical protein